MRADPCGVSKRVAREGGRRGGGRGWGRFRGRSRVVEKSRKFMMSAAVSARGVKICEMSVPRARLEAGGGMQCGRSAQRLVSSSSGAVACSRTRPIAEIVHVWGGSCAVSSKAGRRNTLSRAARPRSCHLENMSTTGYAQISFARRLPTHAQVGLSDLVAEHWSA